MSEQNSTSISDLSNNNEINNNEINNIIENINIDNEQVQKENIINNDAKEIKTNLQNEDIEIDEISYFDILFYELLPSIICIILFFVLSLENVDDILGNYLKFMLNDESRLTYLGILFKSILFGIIFYIINKFMSLLSGAEPKSLLSQSDAQESRV